MEVALQIPVHAGYASRRNPTVAGGGSECDRQGVLNREALHLSALEKCRGAADGQTAGLSICVRRRGLVDRRVSRQQRRKSTLNSRLCKLKMHILNKDEKLKTLFSPISELFGSWFLRYSNMVKTTF